MTVRLTVEDGVGREIIDRRVISAETPEARPDLRVFASAWAQYTHDLAVGIARQSDFDEAKDFTNAFSPEERQRFDLLAKLTHYYYRGPEGEEARAAWLDVRSHVGLAFRLGSMLFPSKSDYYASEALVNVWKVFSALYMYNYPRFDPTSNSQLAELRNYLIETLHYTSESDFNQTRNAEQIISQVILGHPLKQVSPAVITQA